METKVINPYSFLADKQKETLDTIIANLPADPTFEQFNDVTLTAFFGVDPTNPLNSDLNRLLLHSVLPLVYNGYMNGGANGKWRGAGNNTAYTEEQLLFIQQILKGINEVPVEHLAQFMSRMDEKIAASNLSYQQQLPLYVATISGKATVEYWIATFETPGGWSAYFNENETLNYFLLTGWVNASVQGALLAYGILKPEQAAVPDIFPAAVCAVGLTAGKVVFSWQPIGVGI